KLEGAKSTFLKLRDDELLLGLGDTTIWAKSAKDGFAFTTKRIYWRNFWFRQPQRELEYAQLVGPVQITDNKNLDLGDDDRVVINDETIAKIGKLPEFLKAAARVFGTPLQTPNSSDAVVQVDDLLTPHLEALTHLPGLPRVKQELTELTNFVKN